MELRGFLEVYPYNSCQKERFDEVFGGISLSSNFCVDICTFLGFRIKLLPCVERRGAWVGGRVASPVDVDFIPSSTLP